VNDHWGVGVGEAVVIAVAVAAERWVRVEIWKRRVRRVEKGPSGRPGERDRRLGGMAVGVCGASGDLRLNGGLVLDFVRQAERRC